MRFNSPMLAYLEEVLDEHTLPLEDSNAGLLEATWLLAMICKVEAVYREHGLH